MDLITAEPSALLTALLATEVPPDSDVLVLAAQDGLLSAPPEALGTARVVVGARLSDGPLAGERLRRLLAAMERTRLPAAQRQSRRVLSALRRPGGLTLREPLTHSLATLFGDGQPEPFLETPAIGGVHMAPVGRLVCRPAADTPLTGTVTVKSRPVVTGCDQGGRQRLYERLTPLVSYPLVLSVEQGTVTGLRAVSHGSDTAAAALEELFSEDEVYRRVTGVVFGLNSGLAPLPYNTEANTAAAGRSTVMFHLELGGRDGTYRITLPCATTSIHAAEGSAWLADAMPRRGW